MPTRQQILEVVKSLSIDCREYGNRLIGPCPVHNGDNPTAFNINIDESSEYFGNWFCNTQGCHKDNYDITGLVKLMLGCDWKTAQSIIKIDRAQSDDIIKFFSKEKKGFRYLCSKEYVRSKLMIPPDYYIKRGFSKEILEEFDVGLCTDKTTLMRNRVVFPVYIGDKMIGCTGRTVVNDPSKWIVSKGFSKSHHLYGFWKTEEFIRKSQTIILVEGQGDVLKLYESGIKNVAGIFGTALSEAQEFLIQKTGALNLVILMDDDEAGRKAREDIRKKMSFLFNVYDVYSQKDPGDMTRDEIEEIIVPQLKVLL